MLKYVYEKCVVFFYQNFVIRRIRFIWLPDTDLWLSTIQ